ncbi:MAG: deoxycytidylate deaminase [Micavibrio aeruginosavorus]|uniref:Deoxycytidylate deaminase n=1 Tax=Micavibrio aeruginosavorus TaxID=349221 RepID=A0A2W5A5F6_9BACT|nr:MAG: deoxycytidylate deaminase [Micavibrio aeruginosavorus]
MVFDNPFTAMQAAVDIVGGSAHETNKIAATLYGDGFSLSRTNYWPEPILKSFGKDTDIGNSSGTVHAETSCILQAGRAVEGATLCITDPFCPNCAKNIVEAGIKKIYIDHKGFDKDFFHRRSGHFETLSMRICEKAGVSVYQLWRKDERTAAIHAAPIGYEPQEDSPVYTENVESLSESIFQDVIARAFKFHEKRKFALAFAKEGNGNIVSLTARGHAVTGFTMNDPNDIAAIENVQDKYSLFQEPVNRILMHAARHGLTLCAGYLFASQVPTSREQVNLVGAGIDRITIGDVRKSRDAHALTAMAQLSDAKIISYI